VTIASGEAARRGVFLSQAMQGEQDALAQDHAHDGGLGRWVGAQAERRISAPED